MSVRARHLIAYGASMFSLLIFQLICYTDAFGTFSDYNLDLVYSLIAQILCMGIIPITVLVILNKGKPNELRKRLRYQAPRDKKACLLLTLGIMLLITPYAMAFNALTNLLFIIVGYKRPSSVGTIYLGRGDLAMMMLLIAILPAIFEEFTHRGLLLSGLQDRGSEYTAVILSAVMFGLMHTNPTQMFFTTFGGLVFAVAVVKSDSMIPAMCGHFANNAVAVFLEYSTQRQTKFGVWYDKLVSSNTTISAVITFAVLALSLFGMVRLLQYAARKAPKPVAEKKLLSVVPLDAYSPNGKATLKENAVLYATIAAEGAFLLFLFLWGIVK